MNSYFSMGYLLIPYFDSQIVPDTDSRNTFKLAFESFWHVLVMMGTTSLFSGTIRRPGLHVGFSLTQPKLQPCETWRLFRIQTQALQVLPVTDAPLLLCSFNTEKWDLCFLCMCTQIYMYTMHAHKYMHLLSIHIIYIYKYLYTYIYFALFVWYYLKAWVNLDIANLNPTL